MLQGPFLHSGEVVRNSDPLTCLVSNLQILKNLQFCLSPDSPHLSSVSNHQEGIIILTPSPENSEYSHPLICLVSNFETRQMRGQNFQNFQVFQNFQTPPEFRDQTGEG